jgi:predicted metal-dependent phosphoesterase TrpH
MLDIDRNFVGNILENYGRADLHIHTRASDGINTVQEVLAHINQQQLLDVVAITDHDTLDASLWAYEQRHRYPFEIIPGVEVTAREGHVLGLWVKQPIAKGMSIRETVAAIHEQQGVAILAHPGEVLIGGIHVWHHLQRTEVLRDAGLDAIEVYNAGTLTPGNNWLAEKIADRAGLPHVANSDAHTLNAIACGVTRFPGRTAADLRRAITQKQTLGEGESWPLIDYIKSSRQSVRWMLNKFLVRNLR